MFFVFKEFVSCVTFKNLEIQQLSVAGVNHLLILVLGSLHKLRLHLGVGRWSGKC